MKTKISNFMPLKTIFTLLCTFATLCAGTYFSFSTAQRELEGNNSDLRISSFRSLLLNVESIKSDVPKFCGVAISLARYTRKHTEEFKANFSDDYQTILGLISIAETKEAREDEKTRRLK